jgi:general secretion pathway protein C
MRFGIVYGDLPIIGRIDKEAWPRVLGYLFFLFGVLSVFWVGYEIPSAKEIPEANIKELSQIIVSKPMELEANPLLTLLYSNAHANIPIEQSRFRITEKKLSSAQLMAAPVAKLAVKVVGVLSDKDDYAGMAIIERSGRQQSYVSGEKINDTYPIVKILADRIIINENGFYAALMLEN